MTEITLPYGKGHIGAPIAEERIAGWIRSRLDEYRPPAGQKELAEQAMAAPIGSPALAELAQGKNKVVILCSDHTRPVPSRYLLPPMLEQIRQGNPQADITLLVATGCHRGSTAQELEEKFGPEIMAREKIVVHDCDNEENMQYMGDLPSGGGRVHRAPFFRRVFRRAEKRVARRRRPANGIRQPLRRLYRRFPCTGWLLGGQSNPSRYGLGGGTGGTGVHCQRCRRQPEAADRRLCRSF